MDRFGHIVAQVCQTVGYYKPSLVVIEGLVLGSIKSTSTAQLAGLHYLLRWELNERGDQDGFLVVPPSTLKKFVTGKGNAKKDQMLLKTFKRWGVEFNDHNVCDAYGLARYGLAELETRTDAKPNHHG